MQKAGIREDRRSPSAGLNRIRFQGFVSIPRRGIPLAAGAIILAPLQRVAKRLFLALLAWWTMRFAAHPLDGTFVAGSFLHLVNLPFHEAGHVLFSPFGAFMTSLGGSLLQVAVPVTCAVSFARREDWFATCVCTWWAGQNLVDLGPYIADARALQLILLGGYTGAEVEGHDWEAILATLGLLQSDRAIGMAAHVLGSAVMAGAVIAASITTRPRHGRVSSHTFPRTSPTS
jgi:hypothetical protein